LLKRKIRLFNHWEVLPYGLRKQMSSWCRARSTSRPRRSRRRGRPHPRGWSRSRSVGSPHPDLRVDARLTSSDL